MSPDPTFDLSEFYARHAIATGILMARSGCSADEAEKQLEERAVKAGCSVAELAERVIEEAGRGRWN